MKRIFFSLLLWSPLLFLSILSARLPGQDQITDRNDEQDYQEVLHSIDSSRREYAHMYTNRNTRVAQDSLLDVAGYELAEAFARLVAPFWYGTPWDFNGTTEIPGEGKIACGYFVSTLLRDLGLKVERIRMAQQPSENIVKSLCSRQHIQRFRNASLDAFVDTIQEWGKGLYVVGLDYHTGFLYHDGSEVYFIHASYYIPKAVVREKARSSAVLNSSAYRIAGKASADHNLIRSWLKAAPIKTVR